MSEFTPGEWQLGTGQGGSYLYVSPKGWPAVARVHNEADAWLLVAAPGLLAACKAAMMEAHQ